MKKILYTLTVFVISITNILNVWPTSSLITFNPHTQFGSQYKNNGTIETAEITVVPKGAYAEVAFFLTFSAKGQSFPITDSLEVQYIFDLPAGSYITDSWLWIDNYISQALIMDKWTASSIYEGIVKRRRDPSILTKNGTNSYLLKIYPMKADASRKVKITTLIPFNFKNGLASIDLPFANFACSFNSVSNIDLIVKESTPFSQPYLANQTAFLKSSNNSDVYYKHKISNKNSNEKLYFKTPANQSAFVWLNDNGKEKYYQLAIMPSLMFNINERKKTLFIIDIDTMPYYYVYNADKQYPSYTKYSWEHKSFSKDLLNILASNYKNSDSVNLLYAQNNKAIFVSSNWMQANNEAFNTMLTPNAFNGSKKSDLSQLLRAGIEYIKKYGNDGTIVLLTDNIDYNSTSASKPLLDSLKKSFTSFPKINILDLSGALTYSYLYTYFSSFENKVQTYTYNSLFYGSRNNQLYTVLANISGGTYLSITNNNTVAEMLEKIYNCSTEPITPFEIKIDATQGFSYSNYIPNLSDQNAYPDRAIIVSGKYTGTLPIKLTATGFYKNKPLIASQSFDNNQAIVTDTVLTTAWGGNAVDAISNSNSYNNFNIQNAIKLSINHRVLSNYTAFLALEALTPIEPCDNCVEPDIRLIDAATITGDYKYNGVVVKIEKPKQSTDSLSIYPNPFMQELNIMICLADYKNAYIVVNDISGKEIDRLQLKGNNNEQVKIIWNKAKLKKGMYFITLYSNNTKKTYKAVKY